MAKKKLSVDENPLKTLRESKGYSIEEFARILGYGSTELEAFEGAKLPLGHYSDIELKKLGVDVDAFHQMYEHWLRPGEMVDAGTPASEEEISVSEAIYIGRIFQLSDTLTFERLENGDVRLMIKVPEGYWIPTTIESNSWCSVIATMSKRDEVNGGFDRALEFHEAGE